MGCHAPATGEIFKNPTLAATMRELGEKGKREGFYEGERGWEGKGKGKKMKCV